MLRALHGDRQSLAATAASAGVGFEGGGNEERIAAFLEQRDRHGRDGSNAPIVGDVKASLDDLKSGLLSYYSTLYSMAGRSVDERLQLLSSGGLSHSEYPCPEAILDIPRGKLFSDSPPDKRGLLDALPPPNSYENPVEAQRRRDGEAALAKAKRAASPSDPADPRSGTPGLDIDNLQGDPSDFYGLLQLPGDRPTTDKTGALNLLGDDIRSAGNKGQQPRGNFLKGQIHSMLSDIQVKCEAMDRRLVTASEVLQNEVSNPTLREWEYHTLPSLRRKPAFGNREELRRHMVTLYTNLYSRSQSNQRQINALQSKLRVLQMHTKGSMARLKEDPRLGF